MNQIKIIDSVEVARSIRWPNYGVSKCGRAFRWNTEREMSIGMFHGDYPSFRVCHNNKAGWATIHYAIADCWMKNPDPTIYIEVNHKDGNKLNYAFDNLEWTTKSQNQRHAINTGLKGKGEELYNASLTDDQVHAVCQELQQGFRIIDLAKKYDTSVDVIRKIKDGSCYFHIRRMYPIRHTYKYDYSESTVRWVCEQILAGYGDSQIAKESTSSDLTPIDVKRIRNKIRYVSISDEYF